MIVDMEFGFGEMAAILFLFVGTLHATSVRWFDDVGLLIAVVGSVYDVGSLNVVGSLHATILHLHRRLQKLPFRKFSLNCIRANAADFHQFI
jgi:hypothetical protein